MSVYLNGSSVLLDSSSVATDAGCCCGGGECPCPGDKHCCAEGFGFSAFDGSGRRFLTKTTTYHLAYSNSGDSNCSGGVTVGADWVVVKTYGCSPCGEDHNSCDPKCCVPNSLSTYTCIHGFGTDHCTSDIVATCENPDIDGCFTWEETVTHFDGTITTGDTPCYQALGYGDCSPFPVVDSAILQHYTCDNGATKTDELSDECTCSDSGTTAVIALHATGSGSGCPSFDISDSITVTLPSGGGFVDFTQAHTCLSGCSDTYTGKASYLGTMFCESGTLDLFIEGVSICCGRPIIGCDTGSFSCNCSSATGSPGGISGPGVYTFHFSGTTGGLTWTLDVTVTVSFP